jgi:hypothetical protein
MAKTAKQAHEADVFRAFISAGQLAIDPSSVQNMEPDYPDIRCTRLCGTICLFELGELLWEDQDGMVKSLAHGLALSERAAGQKEALVSAGRPEDAERIQTWGGFESPLLGSLLQMLDKKCRKHYETDSHPLSISLLLYYEKASPIEPFEDLFDARKAIHYLLAGSQFSEVWLYHHAVAYTFTFPHMPDGAPEGMVFRAPLSALTTPEEQRRVIGHLAVKSNDLTMSFDASYSSEVGRGLRLR